MEQTVGSFLFSSGFEPRVARTFELICKKVMPFLKLTVSYNSIMLTIICILQVGFIVSVQRMIIMENRPVDPDNIHAGDSPTYVFHVRIKYITRANDLP